MRTTTITADGLATSNLPTRRHITSANEASARLLPALLWFAFLLLSPFYLFESGVPQLADYIVILLFALLVILGRVRIPRLANSVVQVQTLMIVYFMAVNITWAFILNESSPLVFSVYYVFNWLGCLVFLSLYEWQGKQFLRMTAVAVLISVGLQFTLSFLDTGRHLSRGTVFFNNPNQLGYYTLLYGSMFWLLSHEITTPWKHWWICRIIFFVFIVSLGISTLSRATLASLALLIGLQLLSRGRAVAFIMIVALAYVASNYEIDALQAFQERVDRLAINFDEEESHRGYARLFEYPQYLVFGAGEGEFYRFDSVYELHSSLGTVLFSYGLIGLLLFGRQFWLIGKKCGFSALKYMIPVLAFSVTHHGLRQLEFWVLMFLILCVTGKPRPKSSAPSLTKIASAKRSHRPL